MSSNVHESHQRLDQNKGISSQLPGLGWAGAITAAAVFAAAMPPQTADASRAKTGTPIHRDAGIDYDNYDVVFAQKVQTGNIHGVSVGGMLVKETIKYTPGRRAVKVGLVLRDMVAYDLNNNPVGDYGDLTRNFAQVRLIDKQSESKNESLKSGKGAQRIVRHYTDFNTPKYKDGKGNLKTRWTKLILPKPLSIKDIKSRRYAIETTVISRPKPGFNVPKAEFDGGKCIDPRTNEYWAPGIYEDCDKYPESLTDMSRKLKTVSISPAKYKNQVVAFKKIR